MVDLMLHNLEKYEEFSKKLEETRKCAYVAAFGTGKSYVICKYIDDHNLLGHELILCPTTAIIQQWKTVMPELNIITYQKLTHGLPDLTDIRLIVCDEMHHLGGRVWEQKFREMTDGFDGLIAGVTATPIRHLDGGRNTVDEFFDGNVVWGMDIAEAIDAGVLPRFSYTAGLFSLPQYLLENREEACKDEKTKCLYEQLDTLASKFSVHNILHEKLPSENHKVIVFVNRIDNIEEIENIIRGIYPDAAYFSVHRKLSWKQNEENICSFEAYEGQAFLFSIDMLSEGRHIKGVDTVIMFRKTISPNVYTQQLGRCMDGGIKTEPQVFDFVGNLYGLREYQEGTRLAVNIIKQIQEKITRPERQILVDSHVVEMLEVISRITAILDGKWLPEEDDMMRRDYKKVRKAELEKLIPNHTWDAIRTRAKKLGIANENKSWTKEEDDLIRQFYNENVGKERLQELLSGRSLAAIRTRAVKMGIANGGNKPWTKEEDNLIRQFYKEEDGKECLREKLPGRSWWAIINHASQLGFSKEKRRWTKEEDDLIRNLYNEKDGKERLQELLPGRTWKAIRQRAFQLGVTKKKKK